MARAEYVEFYAGSQNDKEAGQTSLESLQNCELLVERERFACKLA